MSSVNLAICENEPKACGADKAITHTDVTMSQFAGKASQAIWLACAIESEGSLQLTWGKRSDGYIQIVPRINLGNQALEYIELAARIFSGKIYHSPSDAMHRIVWYGFKRVKNLIQLIRPYMVIDRKKEIADAIIKFVDYRLARNPHVQYGLVEKNLFLKVRKLNGKAIISSQELKFRFEESSTTVRQTPPGDDTVWTSEKSEELGRNDQAVRCT